MHACQHLGLSPVKSSRSSGSKGASVSPFLPCQHDPDVSVIPQENHLTARTRQLPGRLPRLMPFFTNPASAHLLHLLFNHLTCAVSLTGHRLGSYAWDTIGTLSVSGSDWNQSIPPIHQPVKAVARTPGTKPSCISREITGGWGVVGPRPGITNVRGQEEEVCTQKYIDSDIFP